MTAERSLGVIAIVLAMLVVSGWALDYAHIKGYMPQAWYKYYCMGQAECLKPRQNLSERLNRRSELICS